MAVPQDFNVLPGQRRGHGVRIDAEIVVAEHRVHAVARSQPPQQFRRRTDIARANK